MVELPSDSLMMQVNESIISSKEEGNRELCLACTKRLEPKINAKTTRLDYRQQIIGFIYYGIMEEYE